MNLLIQKEAKKMNDENCFTCQYSYHGRICNLFDELIDGLCHCWMWRKKEEC